jgi:hypothetical protein
MLLKLSLKVGEFSLQAPNKPCIFPNSFGFLSDLSLEQFNLYGLVIDFLIHLLHLQVFLPQLFNDFHVLLSQLI